MVSRSHGCLFQHFIVWTAVLICGLLQVIELCCAEAVETILDEPNDNSTFKFSSCGAQGQVGPTHSNCNLTYKSNGNKVKVTRGIQTWTVPQTGQYSITALGAAGGSGAKSVGESRGAYVHGKFDLSKGQKLHILVGQKGWNGCTQIDDDNVNKICGGDKTLGTRATVQTISGGGGGGGGATFIFEGILESEDLMPLLIAGGGGGLGYNMTEPDNRVHGGWHLNGTGCSGHTEASGAGGGGGWNVSSQLSFAEINQTGRAILHTLKRGEGGSACPVAKQQGWKLGGGFGGGGGGCLTGGGGGGYSGGNLSDGADLGSINGMGGTSFIFWKAVDEVNVEGINLDHGAVEIHLVVSCPCDYLCVVTDVKKKEYECHCPSNKTLADDKHTCIGPGMTVHHIILLNVGLGLLMLLLVAVLAFLVIQRRRHKHIKLPKRDMPQSLTSEINPTLPPRTLGRITDVNPIYDIGSTMANDSLTQDLTQIPRDSLRLIRPLGQGAFGEVYEGILSNYRTEKLTFPVAVKTLPAISTDQAKLDFLMEAVIISKFKHPNIVQFIGICMEKHPGFIVLELLEGGDLKSFLRESRRRPNEASPVCVADLLKLSLDVAKGCKHLEQDHFIHRDIAARNCLLTSKGQNRVAKIADFGMARDIYRADYYKKGGQAMLPVKWMPPEAFMDGIFTTKTDAWSFGVLLWEVFSLGLMPYPGRSNQDVMEFVTTGGRMDPPDKCPSQVCEVMVSCWHVLPERRPSFSTLIKKLVGCSQNEDVLNAPLPKFYSTSTRSLMKATPPTVDCDLASEQRWSMDTTTPSSTAPLLSPQSPGDVLPGVNEARDSDSDDENRARKSQSHKTAFNKLHPLGYQPIPMHDQPGVKPIDRGRLSFDFTNKNNAVPLIPSVLSGSSPNITVSSDPDINFVDSILRRSHQAVERMASSGASPAPHDFQC